MTSCDKKRAADAFELWCYQRLLRVSPVLEKTVLMLRKSMATRKTTFFGHIEKNRGKSNTGEDGRQAAKEGADLRDWTKMVMADASKLAADWETWREIIRFTSVQIVPPDEREREREGGREGGTPGREGGREGEREREFNGS